MQMDFGLLTLAYCPCFCASSFLCSIVSIAVRFYSCQLPSCDLFTSHSLFIVFWERDITSERHGTPVHISTTVYTLSLLSVFTFCCIHHYHYLLHLILCKQQGRRDCQPLCTRWEQSYLMCVQVHVNIVSYRQHFLAPLTPSSISASSSETNLGIFTEGNYA